MENRIRELRKENKIDASVLASKINCSIRTLYKIENGETDITSRTLIILSDLFDCSIDYLLYKSNIRERIPEEVKKDLFLREVIKNVRI